jgi:outer membrane protein TolC
MRQLGDDPNPGMIMTRGNAQLAAILLLASLGGCTRTCYMTEAELNSCTNALPSALPRDLAVNPHDAIVPAVANTPRPMVVGDVDRPIRYVSLAECIAIALEQGNIGSTSALFPGIANDNLVAFTGQTVVGSDSIRVLSLDPAIIGANIESSLARFDARWISSLTWQKTDVAVSNILGNFQNGDQASVSTGVYKPLPTGGITGITFNTDYTLLSQTQGLSQNLTNPAYRPRLQAIFEQPLLQNFGVEINQISNVLPISTLVPNFRPAGGTRTEGILITRLRFDQSRADFERQLNIMLLNVEYAYWNLYGAYYGLYSREQGLRQALVSWQVNKTRRDVGQIADQDLEQTRAQYELFRAQRITALGKVLDSERQLRGLLGMPIEDGQRLVPSDSPTLAHYKADWSAAEAETMSLRPELVLARQELKFRQLDLIVQKNQLKPDLRFFASYDVNGLGTRLDGPGGTAGQNNGNALASFTDNIFNSWQLGFRLDVPIGFRDAHAAVRQARLNLSRAYYQLKDQEIKARSYLAFQYRNIDQYYAEIDAQRAQREANARQLALRFQVFQAGARGGTIDVLLEAQRNFADALASEYVAVVNYNNSLAGYHFAKGTILQYNNVQISEGPLPQCVQVRALDNIRQRESALRLRERSDPAIIQTGCNGDCTAPNAPPSSLVGVPLMGQPPVIPPTGAPPQPGAPPPGGELVPTPPKPVNPPPAYPGGP